MIRNRKFLWLLLVVPLLSGQLVADQESAERKWRDPFWPVGYTPHVEPEPEPVKVAEPVKPPPKPEPAKPQPDWARATGALRVGGFGEAEGKRICFINGKLISEGDSVSLNVGEFRYTWRIERIDPDPEQRKFRQVGVRSRK